MEKSEFIIFWSNNSYADCLRELFGVERVVTSESKLSEVLNRDAISGLIMLAELDWRGKDCTQFYGLEILCGLRLEYRLKLPILVCSFMPESVLRKMFDILDFSGNHPFLHLPSAPNSFISAIEAGDFADEPRLNDIILNYCDLKGRVLKLLTHSAGFRFLTAEFSATSVNEIIWTELQFDCNKLRKYLVREAFGPTVLEKGNNLLTSLDRAIKTKTREKLFRSQTLFVELIDSLTDIKER